MSVIPSAGNGKINVPSILERKSGGSSQNSSTAKITCLTAYDYPTARLLDEAGVDVLLVGDSLAMVALGYESTLPVTMEEMLMCTRAVRRGTRHALLVADMPYGSYHDDPAAAVRNAVRFVKEAGAEAVKLEGGERRMELMSRIVDAEVPVMAHIGLTPQSVNAFGGFRVQGKTVEAGEQLLRDAHAVEAAGAFAVVLESIPRETGGANYRGASHSYNRHWRGARLRRTSPSDSRPRRTQLWPQGKICAAVRRCGRSDYPGSRRILPRRATGNLSFGPRVLSCARRSGRRAGGKRK